MHVIKSAGKRYLPLDDTPCSTRIFQKLTETGSVPKPGKEAGLITSRTSCIDSAVPAKWTHSQSDGSFSDSEGKENYGSNDTPLIHERSDMRICGVF